jgi:ribosomal protein S18 acetylase RimI-like enzyme
MQWIENQARESGCLKVTLDVYASNRSAQNFYIRRGYQPRGVHFVRELT